jgi:hypothetical protein
MKITVISDARALMVNKDVYFHKSVPEAMLNTALATTALHVPSLLLKETTSRYGRYIGIDQQAVAGSRQGMVLPFGIGR